MHEPILLNILEEREEKLYGQSFLSHNPKGTTNIGNEWLNWSSSQLKTSVFQEQVKSYRMGESLYTLYLTDHVSLVSRTHKEFFQLIIRQINRFKNGKRTQIDIS